MNKPTKVAVGLSGGVDSAVAAHLLKEAGAAVTAVFLTCWSKGLGCSTDKDRVDAVRVAKHLGIPIKIWNFENEYQEKVIERFFQEYERGRTPNPDIWCNTQIKFGLFLEKALSELGADYIATGHYARIIRDDSGNPPNPRVRFSETRVGSESSSPEAFLGRALARRAVGSDSSQLQAGARLRKVSEKGTLRVGGLGESFAKVPLRRGNLQYHLLTGFDPTKDQSYFLYRLNQVQLSKSLFPLGAYRKQVIRQIAKKIGLPNAEKPDSQGICFVGEVDLKKFLQQRIKLHSGEVVNTAGEVIGCHDGVQFYTIGQRHGFEITKYQGAPLYVIDKDVKRNRLIVGRDKESEVASFVVEDLHWIAADSGKRLAHSLHVRLRHLGEFLPCQIRQIREDFLAEVVVKLKNSTRGVAPGQHAVFYVGDEVLGGGVIKMARGWK